MFSPSAYVAALWSGWLLGWIVSARGTAHTVAQQSAGSQLAHSVFIWFGGALLFLPPRLLGGLQQPLLPGTAWSAWLGVAVVGVGLGFTVWARVHLGRLWSAAVTLKAGHSLVRTGPYGLTRHPIYTGLLGAVAGTVMVIDTRAAPIGFLLILLGILLKIRQEERLLIDHFGAAYREYQAQVPAIVPRF